SGKSSLAFDTLFAEGQRRYVESLSAYARQFLGRMPKPECDFIRGLPPAIAIEQKTISRNSRSTVGTSTEIYDFLRLLFARVGKTYSPISGELVKKHTADDVLQVINSYPIGTRFAILAPIIIPKERDFAMQLHALTLEGFSRLESNGNFINITSIDGNDVNPDDYKLLIDRMTVTRTKVDEMRLLDSLATAFYEGNDECSIKVWDENGDIIEHTFSKRFEADGMTFEEPSELMFNFNNPLGACPKCEGFGNVVGIDENLVIPNKTLSVYQDAVMCWRGQVMNDWKQAFTHYAGSVGFPIHRPYYQLTQEQKDLLWHGDSNFGGIDEFFNFIQSKSYNIQYRVLLARYRGKTTCPECHGSRLKKEASYVKVGDKTISQLANMPINELQQWFKDLKLSEHDTTIAKRLLTEINIRIDFLINVGLEYLTLDRLSSTLSGGESQRINLASSLGSSLVGSLYILDEPSIGLHSRDTHKLIDVLKKLRNLGNTVRVVEHDEDIIKNADFLIDIGPQAGR
ncbi:MAG: excinuclease ABC subunit A, partial [Muribaculaceae bacterium]|nr:excinuclease ABC subunit A [Muribaculaceae bacterium]